jgi:hypothetical protein
MDKYAMFAVTCSEKFLDMYIDIIKAEREISACRRETLYAGAAGKLAWPYIVSFHSPCSPIYVGLGRICSAR